MFRNETTLTKRQCNVRSRTIVVRNTLSCVINNSRCVLEESSGYIDGTRSIEKIPDAFEEASQGQTENKNAGYDSTSDTRVVT